MNTAKHLKIHCLLEVDFEIPRIKHFGRGKF